MKFGKGNQFAVKPKWTLNQIKRFQLELRGLRESLNYSNFDLARRLDYSTKYVGMIQGDFRSMRQPSSEFITRLRTFQSTNPYPRRMKGTRLCELISELDIPSGTLLPDNAEIVICEGCARKFIRMNRLRRFHSQNCRCQTWRRRINVQK